MDDFTAQETDLLTLAFDRWMDQEGEDHSKTPLEGVRGFIAMLRRQLSEDPIQSLDYTHPSGLALRTSQGNVLVLGTSEPGKTPEGHGAIQESPAIPVLHSDKRSDKGKTVRTFSAPLTHNE